MSNFVIFKNDIYYYNWGEAICSKESIKIEDFVNDSFLYDKIIMSDFNQFELYSDYGFHNKERDTLIKYFNYRKENFNDERIIVYRQLSPDDIDLFYKLEVFVEIKGVRISPGQYSTVPQDYPDDIVVLYLKPEERHIAKQEIVDPWDHRSSAHLVSMSDIDKIIGVKRYRNVDHLNVTHEQDFTGETEEVILDMHNFDEKAYEFFCQHDAFEVVPR